MSSDNHIKIRRYWIYCIVDEILETVFVGKSYAKQPKAQYYSHMRGEHMLTKDAYATAYLTEPEFIILECVYCTGSIAFKHVLAWYNYFKKQGYSILTDKTVESMTDNPNCETKIIYDKVCAPFVLDEVLTRKVEEASEEPEKDTRVNTKKKENLVQFNIRLNESVARAFRVFCKERGLTQSDGLRLLLLGEDFLERDLIMNTYQQKLNEKYDEITCLKKQNKELLELQRGKESWVQHQRKEWIKIAKTMLGFVIDQIIEPQYAYEATMKPLRFKSRLGKNLFDCHKFPQESGCYNVYVNNLVRGLQNKKETPDYSAPIFVCGKMEDGTPVKFRWYPQKDYIGIKPIDKRFGYGEEPWLLCGILSKDGAVDLVCAVPLCDRNKTQSSILDMDFDLHSDLNDVLQTSQSERIKPSLDSMITKANRW